MRTHEIEAALGKSYVQPEWVIFFEVPNSTGGHSRRADAIAMNMWPSRGLEIRGMEIKVSRGDFINEMKNPAKAEAIAKYCNSFYLVVPSGLVSEKEIPVSWGLITVSDKFVVRIQKQSEYNKTPEPLTKTFTASLLRSSQKVSERMIAARIRKETDDIVTHSNERIAREAEAEVVRRTRKVESLLFNLIELNQHTDNQAERYLQDKEFIKCCLAVHRFGIEGSFARLKMLSSNAQNLLNSLTRYMEDFEEIKLLEK